MSRGRVCCVLARGLYLPNESFEACAYSLALSRDSAHCDVLSEVRCVLLWRPLLGDLQQWSGALSWWATCKLRYFNKFITGMTVAELNVKVKEGYRMPFPDGTPPEVSGMITIKCWSDGPNERYSMSDACKFWERTFGMRRPPLRNKGSHHTAPMSTACGNSSNVNNERKSTTKRKKDKPRAKRTNM